MKHDFVFSIVTILYINNYTKYTHVYLLHRGLKADVRDESSLSSFLIPVLMLSWQHHALSHQIPTCVQSDGCKGKDLIEVKLINIVEMLNNGNRD